MPQMDPMILGFGHFTTHVELTKSQFRKFETDASGRCWNELEQDAESYYYYFRLEQDAES